MCFGVGDGGHLQGVLVVGVEDGGVLRHLDDELLHVGEVLERVDAAEAEMVGGDVEHGADVAEAVPEAGTHDAAAGGLEHGDVDGRVAQHHRGGFRAGHVALHRDVAVDVDGVRRRSGRRRGRPSSGRGRACARSWSCRWCRSAPRSGCATGAGGEQHVHDRAADVAALALEGAMCMRMPGPALISQIAPPVSR